MALGQYLTFEGFPLPLVISEQPGSLLDCVSSWLPSLDSVLLTHLPLVPFNYCGLVRRPGLSLEPDYPPKGPALPAQVLWDHALAAFADCVSAFISWSRFPCQAASLLYFLPICLNFFLEITMAQQRMTEFSSQNIMIGPKSGPRCENWELHTVLHLRCAH